jgi:DNA-binding NtrC family response regulator
MGTILIAEHSAPLHQALVDFFRDRGHQVTAARDGAEALRHLARSTFDLVLTELRLPASSGVEIVHAIKGWDDATPVVILADPEDRAGAAEALTQGAQDYLLKHLPFNFEEVRLRVEKALAQRRATQTLRYLQSIQPYLCDYEAIIAHSSQLRQLLARFRRDIATNSPILLTGEPGTGHLWLAATIHAHSPRRGLPFVVVNCATRAEQRLDSALFGHEPGAFPGAERRGIGHLEHANLGTLLLLHIAELDPEVQLQLLRVLQERRCARLGSARTMPLDVRIIAAANRPLSEAVRARRFRPDLYRRLNAIRIEIPPLRACVEDVLPLAHVFLQRYARLYGRRIQGFDAAAQRALLAYPWPGNLHELEATVAQGVLREAGEVMRLSSLGLGEHLPAEEGKGPLVHLPPQGASLLEIERQALLQALQRANWVQKEAAARLDISPRVMHYKLKRHGITHPKWRRRR